MKLLILNGPNLNLLGLREPELYGTQDYAALERCLRETADALGCTIDVRQTNHEGVLVDWIHEAYGRFDGIIINPAAYTHTSIAVADALRAVALPAVEVHLTDITAREPYRRISYTAPVCCASFVGQGFRGYALAMELLVKKIGNPGGASPSKA